MADVMMALGPFRFALATAAWQSFRRSTSWRWASIDRHGRQPARQYLGPGSETVTLSGTIYPHFRGGLAQVSAMRAIAGLGEPLLLVDGTGGIHGSWCIETVEEERTIPLANGAPRRIDFTLTLASYGEDR
jgi:hypothetical protein